MGESTVDFSRPRSALLAGAARARECVRNTRAAPRGPSRPENLFRDLRRHQSCREQNRNVVPRCIRHPHSEPTTHHEESTNFEPKINVLRLPVFRSTFAASHFEAAILPPSRRRSTHQGAEDCRYPVGVGARQIDQSAEFGPSALLFSRCGGGGRGCWFRYAAARRSKAPINTTKTTANARLMFRAKPTYT